MKKIKGKRYNKGKIRYELISNIALKEIAEVYTKGAHKYTIYGDDDGNEINGSEIPFKESYKYNVIKDGADNWRNGFNWMDCIASTKRHIEKFIENIDYDEELNTLHLGNACWNLMTIIDFYKTYPQGDDRPKRYLNQPNIGLDIDEVLCGWVEGWMEKFNMKVAPESWAFDYEIFNRFEEMKKSGELDDFYLNLKPLIKPEDIPFDPHCYITARPVSSEVTMKWLEMHGFPSKPVHTVPLRGSKSEVAIENGVEIFVDDSYNNFLDMNRAGVTTYLLTQKHNKRFDVGHYRINSLKELPIL